LPYLRFLALRLDRLTAKNKEDAIVGGLTHCQGSRTRPGCPAVGVSGLGLTAGGRRKAGFSLLFWSKTRSFAARFTLLWGGFYETIIIKTDHEQLRIDGDFYPCTL
jgi:hypothetical protein